MRWSRALVERDVCGQEREGKGGDEVSWKSPRRESRKRSRFDRCAHVVVEAGNEAASISGERRSKTVRALLGR